MPSWRYFEYVLDDGRCPAGDWVDALSPEGLARFSVQWYLLRAMVEPERWLDDSDRFKKLEGQHAGLHELKFGVPVHLSKGKNKTVQHRIPGLWLPDDREFVAFTGCKKAGRMAYEPRAALDDAHRMMGRYRSRRGTRRERAF